MPLYVKGTDLVIQGTLERLDGIALVSGLDEDGSPIYAGETRIDWDSQEGIIDAHDRLVWVDENGDTWPLEMIEEREGPPMTWAEPGAEEGA
jgi:hypothetical protein